MSAQPVGVLAVIGKPLRKITEVLTNARTIYDTQLVRLECGHEVSCSSRATNKARCRYCQKEIRAALAELLQAITTRRAIEQAEGPWIQPDVRPAFAALVGVPSTSTRKEIEAAAIARVDAALARCTTLPPHIASTGEKERSTSRTG